MIGSNLALWLAFRFWSFSDSQLLRYLIEVNGFYATIWLWRFRSRQVVLFTFAKLYALYC